MNLLFLDTETTGFTHNRLVQLAWDHHPSGETCAMHFLPPVPVEDGAMKVHGKTNEFLADKPAFATSPVFHRTQDLLNTSILVAHNAEYDIGVLRNEGLEPRAHICTMKVARKVFPTEPNHKLQGLFERIKFDVPDGDKTAHDAMGDVNVMIGLFAYMLRIERHTGDDDETLFRKWVNWSCEVPDVMPFGKHAGTPIKDLPQEYVDWCMKQDSFNKSILEAFRLYR